MLNIIQRYLASTFIMPFCLSALFFIVFLLIFKLFSLIRIVTNKGVEISVVFELMGHIALSFIPMAIPLSVLFATMFTLNKMSEDSEIVAMRSFGLKKKMLFLPFASLGLIIAILIFLINRALIPYSKTMFKNTIIQMSSKGLLTDIKSGQFFTEIPGVTLFAEKVEKSGSLLHEVFMKIENKDKTEQLIYAEKGILIKQKLSEYLTPSIRLHLTNGNIVKINSEKREIEKVLFGEYDFPVVRGGDLYGFVTKDGMRTNTELIKVINDYKAELVEVRKHKYHDREREIMERLPQSELEYWSRINTPVQILIFIFLGFGLGIKKGRGRSKNSGVIGLVVLTLYYALFFFGISLARKSTISAPMAVFLPSIMATVVAYYFYRKVDWFS